jgi:hypothetical protein
LKINYPSSSIDQLKEECDRRGIAYNIADKPYIISLLELDDIKEVEVIDWTKMFVVELKDELSNRKIPIGESNKKDMIRKIQEDDAEIKRTRPKYKLKKLSRDEQLQLDLLEEQVHDIELRKQDLIEYRSHLARHKSEDDYAKQVMENLKDDEAIVTSDYKMKLLSCFY